MSKKQKAEWEVRMSEEKPLSENIQTYSVNNYIVTAAIWRHHGPDGVQRDQYEIGCRDKNTGEFKLLQSNRYTHQSVQDVASAICHILEANTTENYGFDFLEEWFT